MRRPKKIVVKCHLKELETIQAKAISSGNAAATYLRELGIAGGINTANVEDEVQRHLYWLAGTMQARLSDWLTDYPELPESLISSMQHMVTALRQLQAEALIDKLPSSELNNHFAEMMSKLNHANKSY